MSSFAPKLQREHNTSSRPDVSRTPNVHTRSKIEKSGDNNQKEVHETADNAIEQEVGKKQMLMMAPNPDNPTLNMKPSPEKKMLMMAPNRRFDAEAHLQRIAKVGKTNKQEQHKSPLAFSPTETSPKEKAPQKIPGIQKAEDETSNAPPELSISRNSIPAIQKAPVEEETTTSDETFKEGEFEIGNSSAVIRDKDNKWAAIKYKAGDADLPTKLNEDEKEVPDESYIGKSKTIPDGSKVDIDDIYIQEASSKTSNDKIKYVHVVDYGWTSVDNIAGGLKNHSVGTLEAVKPVSTDPNHYTVAVKDAIVLKSGNRYLDYEDKRAIALNTEVEVEETFTGYYGDNKSHQIAKVKVGEAVTFTSKGNYATTAHDKGEPNKRKITDGAAYERREISSYIPKDKETISLGKYVIVGEPSIKDTGTYVEVFESTEKENDEGETTYSKGESLGWTNQLNLTQGFHTDLKGLNAKWDQVIPDERYDRTKGKDTEGTAKFTGNEDMIKIVDSKGDIELVSKEIWPDLKKMLDAANTAGHSLQVNTGFRDWDYQQALVDDTRYAANPAGYSSHQIGIAVDLNNKNDTKTGGTNWWMERNAYTHNFARTYKKYSEGHHWEHRPSEVVSPVEIEQDGKKYMKYTFATFSSSSNSIWDRNHVLDEIPSADKSSSE